MDKNEISLLLQEPFNPDDIEWRAQSCGVKKNGDPFVRALAYVTNRAIQQRLDEVFGVFGWQNKYMKSPDGKGTICGIAFKAGDEWVTKWDGAQDKVNKNTNVIDPVKTSLSNSMKRAAVQLGIGRYLYDLDAFWAVCVLVDSKWDVTHNHASKKFDNGQTVHLNWQNPELPEWALFLEKMASCETLIELKEAFKNAYLYAKTMNRVDLKESFKNEYERLKKEIDLKAQANVETLYKAIVKHVDKQLRSLDLIPEKSSVSRVCDSLVDFVVLESEGQYYDKDEIIKSIYKARDQRHADIDNNEENENE